ncbi:Uncharacterized protein FWK35_00023566 [Aphis craccivora]|uniref:MULE domain-containing protein n=1 Tax=Aphis craccivora TaxID=307492 RepID=A0A6G0Y429_APHCR|nr:Uncharacterized protein FWK35_00023566 [Aphis craccivora]
MTVKECYSQTFTHILNECNKRNFNFIPEIVYADFEVAIHTALLTVWPQINIKGCRFHQGQNWWRKIQNVGLSSDYKKNTTLGKYLKKFFGLPFLPPNEVENCFTNDLLSIQPDDERLQIFTEYLFNNYIHPDAKFPPRLWSEFKPSTIRTTNACESFHSHFNSISPEGKRRNCIISKEEFVKEKMTEKILKKINFYEFMDDDDNDERFPKSDPTRTVGYFTRDPTHTVGYFTRDPISEQSELWDPTSMGHNAFNDDNHGWVVKGGRGSRDSCDRRLRVSIFSNPAG